MILIEIFKGLSLDTQIVCWIMFMTLVGLFLSVIFNR